MEKRAICPVTADARLWLLSPQTVIESLIFAHDLDAAAYGADRNVNLPGLSLTVGEMVAALEKIAGPEVVKRIKWESDPRIERLVSTWPGQLDTLKAHALGFPRDENFELVIRQHIRDELGGRVA